MSKTNKSRANKFKALNISTDICAPIFRMVFLPSMVFFCLNLERQINCLISQIEQSKTKFKNVTKKSTMKYHAGRWAFTVQY